MGSLNSVVSLYRQRLHSTSIRDVQFIQLLHHAILWPGQRGTGQLLVILPVGDLHPNILQQGRQLQRQTDMLLAQVLCSRSNQWKDKWIRTFLNFLFYNSVSVYVGKQTFCNLILETLRPQIWLAVPSWAAWEVTMVTAIVKDQSPGPRKSNWLGH